MDESNEIEFNPRTPIGENENLDDRSSELRSPSSSASLHTVDEIDTQNHENETESISQLVNELRDEIKYTLTNVNTENIRTLSHTEARFQTQLRELKDYFDHEISYVFDKLQQFEQKLGQVLPELRSKTSNNNSQTLHRSDEGAYHNEYAKSRSDNELGIRIGQNHYTGLSNAMESQSQPNIQYNSNPTSTIQQLHPSQIDVPVQNSKLNVKPQPYDGSEDIEEYLNQFDILTEINNWTYSTKSLYLASSLKGGARAILSELDCHERRDYQSLVKALNNRFGSVHRSEIFRAKLQSRVKNDKETLPELAQSIKKLTRQAYPGAPASVTDILALDQFIDSLNDSDMRLRVREARPKNINEAEILAVRLETYKQAEKHRNQTLRNTDSNKSVLPIKSESTWVGNRENEIENSVKAMRQEVGDVKKELSTIFQEIRNINRNGQNQHNQQKPQGQNRWRNGQNYQSNNRNRPNDKRGNNQNERGGIPPNNWGNFSQQERQSHPSSQGNYNQSSSWARGRP